MSKIEIRRNETDHTFNVSFAGKMADALNWGETLTLVASLLMPTSPRELQWLKTTQQRNAEAEGQYKRLIENEDIPF